MIQTVEQPLTIALLTTVGLKLVYILLIQIRMSILKLSSTKFDQPVSVIICARNEADNLLNLIPLLYKQQYKVFEVVVVNDRSLDETADVLRAFQEKYPDLNVTVIQESEKFQFNKKFALTIGIKAAKYKHLILTDADCKPSSDQWIQKMVSPFADGKLIAVGYGAYAKSKGVLNKLIRAESFGIAQQYFGLGGLGLPYMGVGRNLGYTKELFFNNKGFRNHQHMNSGDDDLFLSEVANKKNTGFVFDKESYTESIPKTTWKGYLEQKRRHLTTSIKYKRSVQFILLLISVINYSFYVLIALGLLFPSIRFFSIVGITAVLLAMLGVSYPALKKSNSIDLLPWVFISDIFILVFYPFALLYNYLQSGNLWKNY